MANQLTINTGSAPDSGDGDSLYTAFTKVNDNFSNVWNAGPVGSNITISNNEISVDNTNGNLILKPNGIGVIQANASIVPSIPGVYTLGSANNSFTQGYFQDLEVSGNLSGNISLSNVANISVSGDITANGNVTASTFIGNGSGLTGLSVSSIESANTNVLVTSTSATISVDGTSNVIAATATDVVITGNLSVTGNASLTGNIAGDKIFNGDTSIEIQTPSGNANVSINGTSNVAVFTETGVDVASLTSTGNITATGNIEGTYLLGNGAFISGLPASYGNSDVANYLPTYTGNLASLTGDVTTTANVGANNVNATNLSGTLTTAAQTNITSVGTLDSLTVTGNVDAGNVSGTIGRFETVIGNIQGNITTSANVIAIGTPTDGDLGNGSVTDWTAGTYVTDALDDLNEAMENIRNDTYVKSTTFTGSPTNGGEGTTVTLTITSVGNPNRYDITWGDGNYSNNTSDSTPSHTYTDNSGSPYTVTVRAFNNGGTGTGSEASFSRSDYIIIYTADPVVSFNLYRASSGGSALSGNDLYVDEGDAIWLENFTTNTSMADVTYTINWGDGTSDSIGSDSDPGGVGGGRISHTYADGQSSGTGTRTITVTLDSHTTADPSVIPTSDTLALKVYDPDISAPNGLSTKTISFSGSTGSSPLLAASATDNTSGTGLSAGDSVSRTTSTSGTLSSTTTSTYAYNGDAGTLEAYFNGTESGNVTLASGDQSGTYGYLVVAAESDYNLLTSSGSSTSFASSIYTPDLYKGFTTRVGITASAIPVGISDYLISHSTTGNTNTIEFVKDDVTSTPTVDLTSATIAEGTAGTYRYISGVPYYNTGSPTVDLSGTEIYNWIGQTYRNTSSPFEIASGTNDESTSGSVVSTQYKTYAQLDGAVTYLSGGIPIADTGKTSGSAYAIGNVSVALTSSSVYAVETIKFRTYNVNGTGSYAEHPTKIQMFTATPSGFVEDNISVTSSSSLWNDEGLRIAISGASGANPTFVGSTNYYTDHAWSGAETIAGTDEAVVRWNQLKHFSTDLSSGYLPVGPDLATGRSGTQYFRGAFRRNAKSSITVTFTGKISGLWLALPGSTIDTTSGLSGWIDATSTYNGSGVPGTGPGGNGSDGCAVGTTVPTGSVVSGSTYTLTFGTESSTNSTGNQILFNIALASGDYITSWSFG